MRGILRVKGKEFRLIDITIIDLINQLDNLAQVEFEVAAETGRDYFDVACIVYRKEKIRTSEEYMKACIKAFRDKLISVSSKAEHAAKLGSLGLSKSDVALLSNNGPVIQEMAQALSGKNPFEMAKALRFFDIAGDHYQASFTGYSAQIVHGDQPTFVWSLPSIAYKAPKKIENPKTGLVMISDDGEFSFDWNIQNYHYKKMSPYFDEVSIYGDSYHYVSYETIDYSAIRSSQLDFLVVKVDCHDSPEGDMLGRAVRAFPDGLAKEVVVIIDACHSGKYHRDWGNKTSILLTTCNSAESAFTNDREISTFGEFFKDGVITVEGLLRYYGTLSTDPRVSVGQEPEYHGALHAVPVKLIDALMDYITPKGQKGGFDIAKCIVDYMDDNSHMINVISDFINLLGQEGGHGVSQCIAEYVGDCLE